MSDATLHINYTNFSNICMVSSFKLSLHVFCFSCHNNDEVRAFNFTLFTLFLSMGPKCMYMLQLDCQYHLNAFWFTKNLPLCEYN